MPILQLEMPTLQLQMPVLQLEMPILFLQMPILKLQMQVLTLKVQMHQIADPAAFLLLLPPLLADSHASMLFPMPLIND